MFYKHWALITNNITIIVLAVNDCGVVHKSLIFVECWFFMHAHNNIVLVLI